MNDTAGKAMDQATRYFDQQAPGYLAASDRWPWRWLRRAEHRGVMSMAGPLGGAEVLELGCGAGYYTRVLAAGGAKHIWAVDRSPAMLRQIQSEQVTAVLGDVNEVRVGKTFDGIFAAGVFEFVPAAAAVLANAYAHAREGAWLAVLYSEDSMPGAAFRAFHARHGVTIKLYQRQQFDSQAAAVGWRLESWGSCGLFGVAARFRKAPA